MITIAALLGALLPDASLFVMWGIAKSRGIADSVIWSEWYYSEFWQLIGATSNSLPIYAMVAVAGYMAGGRLPWNYRASVPVRKISTHDLNTEGAAEGNPAGLGVSGAKGKGYHKLPQMLLMVFAVAALLHVLTDLPLHHDDGHPHFWPLTNWIYRSPVSYWDPAHYGRIWSLVEIGLALSLIIILWRRFQVLLTRCVLFLVAFSYVIVSFYWWQLF